MIPALQGAQPLGPLQRATGPSRDAETPAPPVASPEEKEARSAGPRRFAEIRGMTVAGSTLIAAQEEASRGRKAAEVPPAFDAPAELSEEEQAEIRELKARDREVRAHEQAHARAGGAHASAPQYELERGPDGQTYAVGGHVSISTSPVPGDPEATIDKMETVRRAALAPAEPSPEDRRAAAEADAKRNAAGAELDASEPREQDDAPRDVDQRQQAERQSEPAPTFEAAIRSDVEATDETADRFASADATVARAEAGAAAEISRLSSNAEANGADAGSSATTTRRTGVDITV